MDFNFHTSQIEISQSAYAHNIEFLKNYLKDNVQISSVVKGNAYGHGISNIVPLAEENGIRHFSVFSADEAKAVKEVSRHNSQIMIMGYVENEQLEWAVAN